MTEASQWVTRFADLAPTPSKVLDLACGGGRHGRVFLEKGHEVQFVDQNMEAVQDLEKHPNAELLVLDLEDGKDWPFADSAYDVIIVANYLYRPHLEALLGSLKEGGLFLYETFALGNEQFGRPRNPDFLLRREELLELVQGKLHVVAFEHGIDGQKAVQRICAIKTQDLAPLYKL